VDAEEPMSELVRSWVRYLRAERKSERTVKLYQDAVRFLAEWLAEQGRPATGAELTRDTFVDYFAASAVKDAPATLLTRYRHLRTFCSFLAAEGEVAVSPMAGLTPPTAPDVPVPVLTDDEIRAMIKAAAAGPTQFLARRDEAIVRMFTDGGPRISEMASMLLAELDVDGGSVWVEGKGGRRRLVMFGAKTGRAVDRYVRARRSHPRSSEAALWLGQRGGLRSPGIDGRLRALATAAGVQDVHAHRFRHTWVDDWLSAGGGEQDLKRLAGWRSDAMLARYGSSRADARAREAHHRLARGDRL